MTRSIFKSLVLPIVLLFITMSISAQTISEEVDLMQSIYGMEKKAVISEFLGDSVNDSFWQVYDAYEIKRKEFGKERLKLLSDYVDNYSNIKGETADKMVKQADKLNKNQTKLISKYTKKIRKASGSEVAAQFYQIEHYLLSATRTEVFENIAFIGDLRTN